MHSFWESIVRPLLERVEPRSIVEVGAGDGTHTQLLLSFCKANSCELHVIDPIALRNEQVLLEHGENLLHFYHQKSLEALPDISEYDVVLIDGDHNWYTVSQELQIIRKHAEEAGVFPLVLLHDVGWPYGRRDSYCYPQKIPSAFRKPYKIEGMVPSLKTLVPEGLNAHMNNALEEGGVQNGVLKAVEDFLANTGSEQFDFIHIPGMHGLGILCAHSLLLRKASLAEFLHTIRKADSLLSHLQTVETQRLESRAAEQCAQKNADMLQQSVHLCEELIARINLQLSEKSQKCAELKKLVENQKERPEEERRRFAELQREFLDIQQRHFRDLRKQKQEHARYVRESQQFIDRINEARERAECTVRQMQQSLSWRWTTLPRSLMQRARSTGYRLLAHGKKLWIEMGSPCPRLVHRMRHTLLGKVLPVKPSSARLLDT